MKHLKTYQLFESSKTAGLTQRQEAFLNRYTKGTWKYNPATGLVDVKGDFNCSSVGAKTLRGVKFGKVSGNFYCFDNKLTSLEGAPQEVGRDFWCFNNNLTSLEGAPQEVGGGFYCRDNQLTSLEGAPQKVGGFFACDSFRLEEGEWNFKGWLKVLEEGSPKAQQLILPLMSPEVLNKEIQQDPAGMIMKLKEVWNDENFRETRAKLVFPKGYQDQVDLVGDLDDIGF